MELFKPRGSASPRRPTDNNQKNGQVIAPNSNVYKTLDSAS